MGSFNITDSMIVDSFVADVIAELMRRYNKSFNEVDDAIRRSGYWDIFNDTEVTLAGAHEGIDNVVERIGKYL